MSWTVADSLDEYLGRHDGIVLLVPQPRGEARPNDRTVFADRFELAPRPSGQRPDAAPGHTDA